MLLTTLIWKIPQTKYTKYQINTISKYIGILIKQFCSNIFIYLSPIKRAVRPKFLLPLAALNTLLHSCDFTQRQSRNLSFIHGISALLPYSPPLPNTYPPSPALSLSLISHKLTSSSPKFFLSLSVIPFGGQFSYSPSNITSSPKRGRGKERKGKKHFVNQEPVLEGWGIFKNKLVFYHISILVRKF